MTLPDHEPGNLVLIIHKPDKDKPRISHIFCVACDNLDQMEGRKETPYCGATKVGPWQFSSSENMFVCLVCADLDQFECPRCKAEGRG